MGDLVRLGGTPNVSSESRALARSRLGGANVQPSGTAIGCLSVVGISSGLMSVDIAELKEEALTVFRPRLDRLRAECAPGDFPWYPYNALNNLVWLDALLTGSNRDIFGLTPRRFVADVGAADGDLGFFLESLGMRVDIVDHGATNGNGLQGARRLQAALKSKVSVHDIDLDSQFQMPRNDYDLVFFLGILYHLKNPYYALEALRRCTRRCVVSTRIARYAGRPRTSLEKLPVAYLLEEREANNDPTNYWIFSETGLLRLFARTGWVVSDFLTVGDTSDSDPSSEEHDERAFCLLSQP